MELRQIRSFVALAEELHFGKAAKRLYLAQPALSQQIRQLEEELGVSLFHRNSRKVELSESGKALLPRALAVQRELALAKDEVSAVSLGDRGTLRVGFISTALPRLIPSLLQRLKKKYPLIAVELCETSEDEQIDSILNGKLDLGIMHAQASHASLSAMPVEMNEMMIALPSAHPLAQRSRVPLKLLSEDTFIFPERMGHHDFHAIALELCRGNGFVPRAVQQVRILHTALPLIAAGAGCALMPSSFEVVKPRGVLFKKLSGMHVTLPIFAVSRSDSTNRILANALAELPVVRL